MKLDEKLLQILACPRCKGALQEEETSLLCPRCALRYPVREGIPVLLVEEAEEVKQP